MCDGLKRHPLCPNRLAKCAHDVKFITAHIETYKFCLARPAIFDRRNLTTTLAKTATTAIGWCLSFPAVIDIPRILMYSGFVQDPVKPTSMFYEAGIIGGCSNRRSAPEDVFFP